MPLFEKRPEIPRTQFKDILKKSDVKVRGRQLSERERNTMEKVDFPKRFGSAISKSEFDRTVNRLEQQKRVEQDFTRKVKIGKKINFLEGLEVQSIKNKTDNSKPKPAPKPTNSSIFGGKQELGRSEFRQKLSGTEGWKAAERAGVSMSASERAKLEKQVFSSSYGYNISKSDLDRGVRQLNQKMSSAKNPGERNTIRRQVSFLKKLKGP